MYLETGRTFLRPFALQDAEFLYQLNLDEEVIRYTGDKPFASVAEAEALIRSYSQYELFGVGRLSVIEKSTGNFLGWCGLKYHPDKDEYDIGYRFFKRYWNQGYATETAASCIRHGFEDLDLTEITGHAMKANGASISVFKKLGMSYRSTFDFEGQEGVFYAISIQDYKSKIKNDY